MDAIGSLKLTGLKPIHGCSIVDQWMVHFAKHAPFFLLKYIVGGVKVGALVNKARLFAQRRLQRLESLC